MQKKQRKVNPKMRNTIILPYTREDEKSETTLLHFSRMLDTFQNILKIKFANCSSVVGRSRYVVGQNDRYKLRSNVAA